MFEKIVKEKLEKSGSRKRREFYILPYKKHRREIYFQKDKQAIKFMKSKFGSPFKMILYFLIRMRILQIFLKKINLPSDFGQVIFVAGQIKIFDVHKRIVCSFPGPELKPKDFIISKKFQKKVSKQGFAPKIIKINEEVPYSKEEFLNDYSGKENIKVFRKLFLLYKLQGIKKIPVKKYSRILKEKLREKHISNNYIQTVLKKISELNKTLLITPLHGDFAKENTLSKGEDILFIDWNPREGLITGDLVNFFRNEDNLLDNKEFVDVLKNIFPEEVQNNIKIYIVLGEIASIARFGRITPLNMKRIKKYYLELLNEIDL